MTIALWIPAHHAFAQRTPAPKAVHTQERPQSPLSLSDILELLEAKQDGAATDIEELAGKRGVSFKRSPEMGKVLRDSGASEKLLSLIPPLPPPPPPPPPLTAGDLRIICKPVDCKVVVNRESRGVTEKGAKIISGLSPGNAEVEVFADDFKREALNVTLEENQTAEKTIVLQPGQAQRQNQAHSAFLAVVNALGDFAGIDDIDSLSKSGNVELNGKGFKGGTWKFSVESTGAGRMFSMTAEGRQFCTANISTDEIKPSCPKKVSLDSETSTAAGLLRDASLANILSKFTHGELSFKPVNGNSVLESKGIGSTYRLTIDSSNLPLKATTLAIGTSDVIEEVEFASYAEFKGLHYPGKVTVSRTIPTEAKAQFTMNVSAPPPSGRRRLGGLLP